MCAQHPVMCTPEYAVLLVVAALLTVLLSEGVDRFILWRDKRRRARDERGNR